MCHHRRHHNNHKSSTPDTSHNFTSWVFTVQMELEFCDNLVIYFYFINSYCNSRILKFSAAGKLLSSWGEESDTRQGSEIFPCTTSWSVVSSCSVLILCLIQCNNNWPQQRRHLLQTCTIRQFFSVKAFITIGIKSALSFCVFFKQ